MAGVSRRTCLQFLVSFAQSLFDRSNITEMMAKTDRLVAGACSGGASGDLIKLVRVGPEGIRRI